MSNSSGVPVMQSTDISTSGGLDSSLGALLVFTLLSMTLWGVTCVQTYEYFLDHLDGLLQQSIVVLLWAIDTLSSAMHCHTIYYYLISKFGNPSTVMKPTWGINCQPIIVGVSSFIVRTMFARRIYTLSENNIILTTCIMSVSTCDFVVTLCIAIKGFSGAAFGVGENISRLIYVSFVLSILSELSVAISLCWLLHRAKSGFRRTDSIINVLMFYVVNTGLLVAIDATIGLITYIAMPDTMVSYGFMVLLPKLYVNAYLASLNARGRLREKDSDTSVRLSRLRVGTRTHSTVLTAGVNDSKTGSSQKSPMAISFETSVERRVDNDEMKNPLHV